MTMKLEDLTLEEIMLIHKRFQFKCAQCPLCSLGVVCSALIHIDLNQEVEVDKKCE